MIKSFFNRLIMILGSDLLAVRWLMGWAGIYAGLGFLLLSTSDSNYAHMIRLFSQFGWAEAFIIYGVARLAGCLMNYPKKFQFFFSSIGTLISIAGMYFWSYLLMSFTVYDPSPLRATELLLILPISCELWSFTNTWARLLNIRKGENA